MKKASAIEAVIQSAIQEFAQRGFAGASLRDVAQHAQVPLVTIHRYFGTKLDLYHAVQGHVWDEISVDRDARLELVQQSNQPTLDTVLRALIEPVVLRVFAGGELKSSLDIIRFSPQTRLATGEGGQILHKYNRITQRWLNAIHDTLPGIAGDRLVWAFSLLAGSLYCFQLFDHLYDDFLSPGPEIDADHVTNMMVAFASGGLRALRNAHGM